jgi:chitinase
MHCVKFKLSFIMILCTFSNTLLPGFESEAYIPEYRLIFKEGAENTLGRPAKDTSPDAWIGRLIAPAGSKLPENWYESDWSLRLARGFDRFHLHMPLGTDPDFRKIAYLKQLVKTSSPEVFLSLMGNSEDFSSITETEENLKQFAEETAELCRDMELDGIDIDWEFPSVPRAQEKAAFNGLVYALRKQLPEGTALSIAFSRWRLPDPEIFEIVDELHLMAYDGYGKHSTFESALADVETVLTRYHISPGKLVLGIPYYGRIFRQESGNYRKGTKNYAEIVRDYAPEPSEDIAGDYFFNGPRTVERKTEWAVERGLAGIFVWEPFYDADAEASLTEVIHRITDPN